jgi:hypothetical protein
MTTALPRSAALQALAEKWPDETTRALLAQRAVLGPYLDPLEPIPREHIERAAERAGIRPEDIDATVAALSAHLGWDNLRHVNRIPQNTQLTFGPAPGLTVVFGPNGAGKSGYARVLKKACQTRGAPPAIEPNAHLLRPAESASADIAARHGAAEFTHTWVDGTPPEPRLAQAFVFDTATAANYLSTDGPTTFTPFGLDILPKLSQTCDRVRERIERERADLEARCQRITASWGISEETATGLFLHSLSAKTKPSEIDSATAFSPEDERTRAELETTLKADPRQKAKATRASADRIEQFVSKCETRMVHLSQEALNRLAERIRAAVDAQTAAKASSERRFPEGMLPGTGGDLWKRLWAAAQEFATSAAYPGLPFPAPPDTNEAMRCVLCQQDLLSDARTRFADFATFMADQSQKLAAEAREGLAGVLRKLDAMQLLAPDAKGVEADVGETLAGTVNAFAAASDQLLLAVRDHVQRCDPSAQAVASIDVAPLKDTVQQLRERASREEAALDPAKREEMSRQLASLQARAAAAARQPEIAAHVQALQKVAALAKCINDTSTTAITRKSTELTKQVVTDAYLSAFETRLDDLGLQTIQVKMTPIAGRKGEAKYGIRLKPIAGGASADVNVGGVASEGEQRCIALAAFLAELSQASHLSTLVFDDPVCSLDHSYRTRVAGVLAKESGRRQVIVFTHDLVFLHDLGAAAEEEGTTLTQRCVEWDSNAPGVCREDVPWEGKKVEGQLDDLENRQRRVARSRERICTSSPRPINV